VSDASRFWCVSQRTGSQEPSQAVLPRSRLLEDTSTSRALLSRMVVVVLLLRELLLLDFGRMVRTGGGGDRGRRRRRAMCDRVVYVVS